MFGWLAPPQRPAAGTSEAGAGLARFTGYGLTFTHPRSWHSLAPAQRSAYHATTLAFESTAPLRDTGRAPVAALPPGGVLVGWSITGPPGTGPAAERGQPQTIAGYQAWLSSRAAASGPACRNTPGASRLVEATISASPRLIYQMLSCISGPDTSQSVNSVMAMLNSLRLGGDPGA